MILLIDNFDSFSYNLYQLIGSFEPNIKVIRNNEMTLEEIEKGNYQAIIISPGPKRPKDAGIVIEAIKYFKGKVPILGVCLGHQAICEAFGATVSYAKEVMHGKTSVARLNWQSRLFEGMADEITVARYHSLAVIRESIPAEINIIAETEDGEVMAIEHKNYDIYGVQFHPESILTKDGAKIIKNFLRKAGIKND